MATPTNFNERRTAQAAAFLLHRAGGRLPSIKLVKLLYLAERKSLEEYGVPISGDRLMSLRHGPVMSITLDHINGFIPSSPGGWDTWVADKANHFVALSDPSMIADPAVDLGALSESDVEVLDQIWADFGKFERWALVEYTHTNLPEWRDPGDSNLPITYESLLANLGYDENQVKLMVQHFTEQAELSKAVAAA
ncbi:SocA family protein [Rhodoferax sp. AJA081-3]|uniref:Panacea domain-containing protein n=1 Tax=Rhodoferax sp. AJA081-3 TaxID=2752316 RepID=UPI001AE07DC7|nr:Panacea domain-containing protein [Rhodoferax sp. AJA081-3]QTN27474.1 SocA family protein [Rhodoferax sp. AJA081-3]